MYLNSSRTFVAAILLVASTQVALADPADDFAALERELESATDAFVSKLDELLEKNPELDLSDPRVRPADPRFPILARMDAVAAANPDKDEAREMAGATLFWSIELGDPASPRRLEQFVQRSPDNDLLAQLLLELEYAYHGAGDEHAWHAVVSRLAQQGANTQVKEQAMFLDGRLLLNLGQAEEAAPLFKTLAASENEEIAERAKGFLYEARHLQPGMTAPPVVFTRLDGSKLELNALRGKIVLLDFWATWCPGCIAELPTIRTALDKFGDKLEVVSISGDEDKEILRDFVKVRNVPGIATHDMTNEGEFPLMKQFNVEGLPTWFLLDTKGRIVTRDPFGSELVPAIEKAIALSTK